MYVGHLDVIFLGFGYSPTTLNMVICCLLSLSWNHYFFGALLYSDVSST